MSTQYRIINNNLFSKIITSIELKNLKEPEERVIIFDNQKNYNPKSTVSYILLKDYLNKSERNKNNGTLNKKDIEFIFKETTECFYCDQPFEQKEKTLDHYIPSFFGGFNMFSNVKVACQSCNTKKGAINPLTMKETFNLYKNVIQNNTPCSNLHILLKTKYKDSQIEEEELLLVEKLINVELYWRKKAEVEIDLNSEINYALSI